MRTPVLLLCASVFLLGLCAAPTQAALKINSRSPYLGAIVVDAATGKVLFEDNASAKGYPASVTKLMVLLVVLEAIENRQLKLDEKVTVTREAARIGGSQVYLKENEVLTVDDLLYALIVQSANDAAAALAIHHAGSKEAFVKLMNARAQKIGMKDTVFHSVHGLPPGKGQLPDVSTARDLAALCREIVKKPKALKYTSTTERTLRHDADEPFVMRSHNPLLKRLPGCDGLKTGYFRAAGWSIAATATKNDQRAIAVVLGSSERKVRDAKAKKILSEGLAQLALNPPPAAPPATPPATGVVQIKTSTLKTVAFGAGGLLLLGVVLFAVKRRARPSAYRR
jgi:D-alanyl-D-alanine carboxypeptidase (penicillin-binding protein 5/6)